MAWMRKLYGRCLATLAAIIGSNFAMAADPGVGEWTTFGNGPSHSGYYPRTIGTGQFAASWTKIFTTRVNQVAVSGDTIYATTNGYFTGGMRAFALKVADGAEKWIFPLSDAYSVNPPTYASGRVYFQRGNHEDDTHLWSLDAASGALRFAAPHSAQWENYAAPTIAAGGVFVNGGAYGGMYGFDATTGVRRFFISNLAQEDGWTPSYADGVVYACVNGIFTAYDPQTGTQLWSRDLKTTTTGSTSYWNEGNIPVISEGKAAIVGGGRIVVINLATRAQMWSKAGTYHGTPSFADGRVYAFLGGQVVAYDAANGNQVASYSGGGSAQPMGQALVTKDLLIYSNGTRTYVFDRATAQLRQDLAAGGNLSYASGRLYVVSDAWGAASTLATFTITPQELDPPAEPLPPAEPPASHPNPARPLGTTTVAWLDSVQSGGIAYFLFDSPAKIERYDLATSSWLDPISLPSGPTGFNVSGASIYVAFGYSVSKFPLDGSTETRLGIAHISVKSLFELNGRLYLVSPSGTSFLSIDPVTGSFLGAKNYTYSLSGISVAGSKNKVFGRSTNVSPSDIVSISLNADGSFGAQTDSPYHGTYPSAVRTFLFPGEARIVENSGIIYSTGDLSYLGSLAGAFDDIAFSGEKAVLLRGGNTLVAYSAGLAEIGRKAIAGSQSRIYADDTHVFSFARENGRGVVVTKTAMADIVPDEPPVGIDPTSLTYTPDAIEFGTDTVFLLSKLHQSVFRWSISQQQYLPTIALNEIPQLISYSPAHNRLYLAYTSGRIGKVELAGGNVTESAFVNLARVPTGMVAAGDFMFFAHPASSGPSMFTYNADGALVGTKSDYDTVNAPVWNPVLRRVLYATSTSSYGFKSVEIDLEGKFGQLRTGSYSSSTAIQAPFSVSPDGARAAFSNGAVHNASDLTRIGELPVNNPPPSSSYPYSVGPRIIDSAWFGGVLHTIRGTYAFGSTTAENGAVESWNLDLARQDHGVSVGSPLRLGALADGLLVVSMYEGHPIFTRFNAALEQVSSKPGDQVPAGGPVTRENPVRPLGQTTTAWLDVARYNGIAYFLFSAPAKIERYDTIAGEWLEPISLPDGPRALAVGASGIYVSFGKSLSRFSFDGATETVLLSGAVELRPLAEQNGRIYVTAIGQTWGSARYGVADLATGSIFSEANFSYSTSHLSFSPLRGKFFGRTTSVSPSDILQITLKPDGSFGTQTDSPYHADFPSATKTFLFPGEGRVVDDAGVIYSTTDLTYLGSLAGAFNDLDFIGDGPVVLRNNSTLVAFSAALVETGRATLAANQERIYVGGDFVHSFSRQDGRGVKVTRTAISAIAPPEPPEAIDPTLLAYTPDQIEFGGDTVFLLSKLHQSVFRWSVSQRQYLQTIALAEVPQKIAYSAAHNRLYLSYATGRVTQVDLGAGTSEIGFVNFPNAPIAMVAAGDYMFFGVNSEMRYTYRADGTIAGSGTTYLSSSMTAAVWNGALRRVFFASGTSPYDFRSIDIDADGKFGQYRGGSYSSSATIQAPMRISPDGSRAVFANAAVFNPADFSSVGTLPVPVPPDSQTYPYVAGTHLKDSTWLNGVLHTVRNTYLLGSSTPAAGMVEAWNSDLTRKDSGAVGGAPLALHTVPAGVLVVSMLESKPVFTLYSPALEPVHSGPIDNPAPTVPVTRDNPARVLADTDGPWIDAAKYNGIAYFLFSNPAKIERFDLVDGLWLQPISLPENPRFLHVGLSGIYVSFGKAVSRFSFDGTKETVLLTAGIDVRPLAEQNGRLYLVGSTQTTRYGVVELSTGTILSDRSFYYGLTGFSFSPGRNKFFGRSVGVSPADIVQVTLNADGTLSGQTDSPHHGGYPNATRTFLFPNESWVIDNAGTIYATSNLNYAGRLGGSFTDLDFAGEHPIVLRSGELVAYNGSTLIESGRKTLPAGVSRIFAAEDTVTAFSPASGRGVSAIGTALSDINPPDPIDPIDPTDLDYTPEAIEVGEGGVIYLLSQTHRSVFRWSISEGRYLPTIQLSEAPWNMAYSKALNRLYFTYPTGRITKIDPAQSFEEVTVSSPQQTPVHIQTAGEYLFTSAITGYGRHSTFSSAGVLINSVEMSYQTRGHTWSEANRRMYFLRDDEVPTDLGWQSIDAEGQITEVKNRPSASPGVQYPVRVSPDGSVVLLGTGDVYDALTLERIGALTFPAPTFVKRGGPGPTVITDAAWLSNVAYTLKAGAEGLQGAASTLHRWNEDYQADGALELQGAPLRLFPFGNQLVAIVMNGERPDFVLITPELDIVEVAPPPINLVRLSGTYFASLLLEPGTDGPMGGLLKLTLNPSGKATGALKLDGKTYRFRTQFDDFGHAVVSLSHKGKVWTLQLDLSEGLSHVRLRGSLSSDDWVLSLSGSRARTEVPADRQLFLLSDDSPVIRSEVPPVVGHGVMTISENGNVRIEGTLLIGGKVTQGTMLLEDGSVVLNLMSKEKDSFLNGKIAPTDSGRSTWQGLLAWEKNGKKRARRYANEIQAAILFGSSRYLKGNQPLQLAADRQVTLALYGGDLPMTSVTNAVLQQDGRVMSPFGGKAPLARINVNTGLVSGSFIHPGNGKKVPFSGVVIRSLNQVFGGFLGPKQGGVFQIAPRMPESSAAGFLNSAITE